MTDRFLKSRLIYAEDIGVEIRALQGYAVLDLISAVLKGNEKCSPVSNQL